MFNIDFTPSLIVDLIFNVLYFAVIIGTIIVILLDNRNPVKTITWVLVLTFLPFVGLLFYFFFGRSTRKEKLIEKKSYDRLLQKPIAAYRTHRADDIPSEYHALSQLFWNINQAIPFHANEVDVYTNGYVKLQALIKALYRARNHIHIQYYIFMNDAVGRLIRDVLIDKAREGVVVRLIYDDVGSWKTNNLFFEEMRDAGIEARSFMKVRFPLFTSKVNYRNHRKIVVIDGEVGFIGGMNIAERYVKGFPWGNWRDTHIRLTGRAVYGLQTAFLLDWYFVDRTLNTSSRYFPHIEPNGTILTQIVTSEPVGAWKDIMQGMAMAISTAQKSLYIQTPYFLPSEVMLNAMQSAALAGVDVRLMIPARSDNRITQWASFSYLKDVLSAGVKVYFYKAGFLHAKSMIIDDKLSSVGSTNIDFRSFEHNFEVNAFIYDTEVALNLKEIFLADQRNCELMPLKRWDERALKHRMIESVVRLFAPLL